jgi:RimJ/RimL family protein N-acetyltransferase
MLRYPLVTARLLLRPFEDTDLDAVHDMEGRQDVARYLDWPARNRDEVREAIARRRARTLVDDPEFISLAGVLKATGTLVGGFSVRRLHGEHQQGEIGMMVHPDHQGCGYAYEAAQAMLRLGFEHFRCHRIVGRCDGRNQASARLMERLGMRREAFHRQSVFAKGRWRDELVYAMLSSEFARNGSGGTSRRAVAIAIDPGDEVDRVRRHRLPISAGRTS